MNEMMLYEDIRDELALALGDVADDAAIDALSKGWVDYLEETKAENSRPPLLVALPAEVSERSGYEGAVYALRDDMEDVEPNPCGAKGPDRNATGILDQPRLLGGRMFQVQDILNSIACAIFKSSVRDIAKEVGGQVTTTVDPVNHVLLLATESVPDLISDFRSFATGKAVEGPEERAIAIMAFSQYETDLHDTKNEPFTAKAMVEWLRWARDDGAPGMPPRVRGSVRGVRDGSWEPSVDEVETHLRSLADKGFFKCVRDAGMDSQYRINV